VVRGAIPDEAQSDPHHATAAVASAGASTRPATPTDALRRLILPLLCALGLVGATGGAVQRIWYPTFWRKTAWLMHDPYHGGEIFDRIELDIRLSHLENSDPNIISVGNISGFFSLQAEIPQPEYRCEPSHRGLCRHRRPHAASLASYPVRRAVLAESNRLKG
jgi:hypothetical protein